MFSLKKTHASIAFLIIVLGMYVSFAYLIPSETALVKINNVEFSQEKALVQLKEISQKEHYVGAPAHKEVRDYVANALEKLGLEVEIQQQLGINKRWHSATQTQNIIAKIKGSSSNKSLLLLAHYDSNPHSSLGASDTGSGVVTILEGIRVYLETHQTPKNDIIILFSDAEEIGLNGADAFVNHHPWAKNVGLVLNFEARGSGGPSYMLLETNGGNSKLITAFIKANPKYPVANSLMYSIYKMLPNDTDLTVFREDANINGFNFAFIDDHFDYHTAQDSYERLDRNTLKHQATYLMPLLNYFSNTDLSQLNSKDDLVYFTLPFVKMISYPFAWVTPLTMIAFLLFLLLCLFGLMRGRLTLKGIGIGFIPLFSALFIAIIVAIFGWKLLLIIHPQYNDILHGFTYNGYDYIAGFVALSFAITYFIYNKFKKFSSVDLSIAPLFLWLFINVMIAIYLKGSGFFIIPVYFALCGLAITLFTKDKAKNNVLAHSLLALPLLLIFAPLVKMFPVGLGLKNLFISAFFVVLMMGLLVPVLAKFRTKHNLVFLGFAISVLFFVKAALNSGYAIDRKKPNSILYVYDADAQKAYWSTYNHKIDPFTAQFLGKNPVKGGIDKKTVASKYATNQTWHTDAKLIDLKAPMITNIKDSIVANANTYHFIITPQRTVNRIELIANTNLHFISFSLNGVAFTKQKGDAYVIDTEKRKHLLSYYFTQPNESLTLEFALKDGESPDITLYEASYDLFTNPNFNITPRTDIMMPMPFVLNDAIVIKKQLNR